MTDDQLANVFLRKALDIAEQIIRLHEAERAVLRAGADARRAQEKRENTLINKRA